MLVSWGLIKNGYIGSPLQCYFQTGSGPIQSLLNAALWALLLQDAQHLPESIAQDYKSDWNSNNSSFGDMTPCTVKLEQYAASIDTHFF